MNLIATVRSVIAALLASLSLFATAAGPLPSYNIDRQQVSVSGLSSGGFMALQLHVAFSATFRAGAGIVAGGPYFCAEQSLVNALGRCMAATPYLKPPVPHLATITDSWAGQGLIDATANLRQSKVYLFSGSADTTVNPLVMETAHDYYKRYVDPANIYFRRDVASEHAMVTDFFGNACSVKGSPYINNCNFDLAGAILRWIYGPLEARNDGTPGGSLVEFRQTDFIATPAANGVADTGWAYVPAACSGGEQCRLHVVLHGCQQDPTRIQDRYYRYTGYNKWADTNRIVVLYPQAAHSSPDNPNGCWDWWGYGSADYARKSGPQMQMIGAMVARVSGDQPASPAPAGLQVTRVEERAVALSWDALVGATGYYLYRDGQRTGPAPIHATTHTDTGLVPGRTYAYAVSAQHVSGEGARSDSVTATTRGSFSCTATFASNYQHVQDGRAYRSGFYAIALGSQQNLGFYNIFWSQTLAQIAPDYYVIGACP